MTERKRAEQDLLKERTLLKAIIDNIPVMLIYYSPEANILYLNKEFEKIVGWKTEEVRDIDLMEKVYPDPDYRQQAMEYMQKASTEWREFRVQSKSGKIIDSEWSNIILEDGTQRLPDGKRRVAFRRNHDQFTGLALGFPVDKVRYVRVYLPQFAAEEKIVSVLRHTATLLPSSTGNTFPLEYRNTRSARPFL